MLGRAPLGAMAEEPRFAVKVMPPQVVKAYRVGLHKSDRRDQLAIAEAMVRPQVPGIAIKSERAERDDGRPSESLVANRRAVADAVTARGRSAASRR